MYTMVVANMMMGLGNQMFQYAAARSLSLHLQTTLKLNIQSYNAYHLRKYELTEFFEIDPLIATDKDMAAFQLGHPVRRAWNSLFSRDKIKSLPHEERKLVRLIYEAYYLFKPPQLQHVYEERQFHYDPNFFKAVNPVFLKGYWMSPKYFDVVESIIKKDFTIRKHLVAHLQPLVDEMHSNNSVAIHVRCTDRKQPDTLKMYGEIPASYFNSGVDYIKKQKGSVHLYVFSDDEAMAKKYIPPDLPVTYVSNSITKRAIEDFYLITQCSNVVMTNSTFSWWAAYLNNRPDKIIITPRRWFNECHYNYNDVYYPGWIKMDN